MAIEFKKESINLKVDLMTCLVTLIDKDDQKNNGKEVKKVSGDIISYTTKVREDGNVTGVLGIEDDDSIVWITHKANAYFSVDLYSKILSSWGKKNFVFEFYKNKGEDRNFLNVVVYQNGKKVISKWSKSDMPSKEILVENMLYQYGKTGQPKASDEVEPTYEDEPQKVGIDTLLSKDKDLPF